MHVQQRIEWAKQLVKLQLIIMAAILIIGLFAIVFGVSAQPRNTMAWLPGGMFFVVGIVAVLLAFLLLALAYYGLSNANKSPWGIIAYATLAIAVLSGQFGLLTLLPLAALIFLIDGETFTYMTGKEIPNMETQEPHQQPSGTPINPVSAT